MYMQYIHVHVYVNIKSPYSSSNITLVLLSVKYSNYYLTTVVFNCHVQQLLLI